MTRRYRVIRNPAAGAKKGIATNAVSSEELLALLLLQPEVVVRVALGELRRLPRVDSQVRDHAAMLAAGARLDSRP